VGLALVEVAADADVPVGQREDRLRARERVEPQLRLGQGPRLDREDVRVAVAVETVGQADELLRRGADVVVTDLADLLVS
jgi:hypothetical protein